MNMQKPKREMKIEKQEESKEKREGRIENRE